MPPKPTTNNGSGQKPTAKPTVKPSAKVTETSEYTVLDPRNHKRKLIGVTILRLLLIAFWAGVIALGAREFIVVIHDKQMLGYTLNVDTQLAFLGVFNKVMDVWMLTSLQDLSHVLVFEWMLSSSQNPKRRGRLIGRGKGARLGDLEMFEELSKPWRACAAFWKRWQSRGWKNSGFWRFLLALIIGLCIMLQGLAINLIGMPKDRWYPDMQYDSKLTLTHPSTQIQSIDNSLWSQGFDIIGGGQYSWDAAGFYSTAKVYVDLQDLVPQFSGSPPHWVLVGSTGADTVTLDTRFNGTSPMRGYAVKSAIAEDIFYWAQAHGPSTARATMGWIISLKMIVPMVSVTCVNARTSMLDTESIVVDSVSTNISSFTLSTRQVTFDDQPGTVFPSVKCSIKLSRTIVPVWSYVRDNYTVEVDPDAYINNKDMYNERAPESADLAESLLDVYLADQARRQIHFIASRFEDLIPGVNAAQLLARNALHLRSVRPNIKNDASAIAPAIALFAAHGLAHSSWNYTLDTNNMLVSSPVRWQLLYSGPWLGWEWVSVLVLAVLVLVTLAGAILSVISRMAAPGFLKPPGLFVAGNLSAELSVLKQQSTDGSGGGSTNTTISHGKAIERQTLFLREKKNNGAAGRTETVSIVQDADLDLDVDPTQKMYWS